MDTKKSAFSFWKLGLQLLLTSLLGIILYQNAHPVDVELLFWEVHIPLVFLLLGMTLAGALLVFLMVLWKGR